MNTEDRIHRHGRSLMLLASLGLAFAAGLGLLTIAMPWLPSGAPDWLNWDIGGIELHEAMTMTPAGKAMLSLAAGLWTLAYLVPLQCLRRFGQCLYRDEALSRPVADAMLWLAHSLPICLALTFAATLLALIGAEVGTGGTRHSYRISFAQPYLLAIACLGMYSVAHIMRLAAEAADDSRSIV